MSEHATQSASGRRRLEALPTRRRLTGAEAAARSLWVRRLRIGLPIGVIGLVVVFLANTRSGEDNAAFLEDFKDSAALPEQASMAGASIAGVTKDGKPYRIEFDQANQIPGSDEVVSLEKPRAVTQGAQEETIVAADRGEMRSKDNILTLTDNVTLNHAVGGKIYRLTAPSATVNVDEGVVVVDSGVEGASEDGTLRADRMRAYNGEQRVVFEGNVSMRLNPRLNPAAAQATDEDAPQ